MHNSLNIKIDAETEESLFSILNHIVKEITQGYHESDILNSNYSIDGDMLKINHEHIRGKYSWSLG